MAELKAFPALEDVPDRYMLVSLEKGIAGWFGVVYWKRPPEKNSGPFWEPYDKTTMSGEYYEHRENAVAQATGFAIAHDLDYCFIGK